MTIKAEIKRGFFRAKFWGSTESKGPLRETVAYVACVGREQVWTELLRNWKRMQLPEIEELTPLGWYLGAKVWPDASGKLIAESVSGGGRIITPTTEVLASLAPGARGEVWQESLQRITERERERRDNLRAAFLEGAPVREFSGAGGGSLAAELQGETRREESGRARRSRLARERRATATAKPIAPWVSDAVRLTLAYREACARESGGGETLGRVVSNCLAAQKHYGGTGG